MVNYMIISGNFTVGGFDMVEVYKKGAYLLDGTPVWANEARDVLPPEQARQKTIA